MKILLFNILLLISTLVSYSQNFGVRVGTRVNISDIDSKGVDINQKMSFEGGVFYLHPISIESLSIRAAILYFRQEFGLKNDMGNNIGITYHFREDNLKLPLTVEWRPMAGLIKPFIQAGLYVSHSISGNIKDSDSSNTLKYRKGGHKSDYGAIIGVGLHLTPHIALNANYEHGFFDRDMVLGDQFVSVKNRGCLVMLYYLF